MGIAKIIIANYDHLTEGKCQFLYESGISGRLTARSTGMNLDRCLLRFQGAIFQVNHRNTVFIFRGMKSGQKVR
jgi:hypothetical protein